MGPDPGAARPGQPGNYATIPRILERGTCCQCGPGPRTVGREPLPPRLAAAASALGPAGLHSRYGRTRRHGHGTSAATAQVGQRCPCLSCLSSTLIIAVSPPRMRGRGRDIPRPGAAARSPAVAALLPCTAPEPRPLHHPRANRSETDPGTCSSPPLWLCLVTTPRVTRCQHQLWSRLLEHSEPWPCRSHAAASPQGSRSGEATARAPWHPGPAATVTLSRAPLSLRLLGATGPGASPPWGGDGGPARDSGRRHPGQVLGSDSG